MSSALARVRAAFAAFASERRGRAWWWVQLEVGLIGLLMFLLRSPFDPGMPGSGLDPSWRQALPEASARGLQIGRDVVYSFGPLSGIYSNEYHPAVFVSTVCVTLLLCAVFAVLLQRLARLAFSAWWSRALVMVAFTLLVAQHDCFSFAFAPLGVALLFSEEPPSAPVEVAWWWSMATLTLVKASFGAIGALIFVIVLLTRLRDRPRLVRLLAFPVSCVGMWLSTGQNLLSLPYYALNSLHVSTGYAASMSFPPPAW
ncbi:MAG TPA: hypothetical protein VMF89_27490, partial [Polyangiales bacterium]|nr:hypothetical protein [Polyangiales bacterium]